MNRIESYRNSHFNTQLSNLHIFFLVCYPLICFFFSFFVYQIDLYFGDSHKKLKYFKNNPTLIKRSRCCQLWMIESFLIEHIFR